MRKALVAVVIALTATSVSFAQPHRALSSIFRSKLAFYLPAPDSTPVSTQIVVTSTQSPTISQNTWIEIHGANLAQQTQTWDNQDFSKGLPTSMGGVAATVNNLPAAVYYISPTQINILTPIDPGNPLGPVPVQVQTNFGKTAVMTPTMQAISPAFIVLDLPTNPAHVAARHANYSLLGPSTLYPGLTTPAQPGETVLLYATGFGQPSPPITNQLTGQGQLPTPWPTVTIGGAPATVSYAGLTAAGLYQFNVVIPANAPNGDLTLAATYNGVSTQANVVITVQQ